MTTNGQLLNFEASLRVIAEAATDAIITIDEESTIVFVHAAAERIFGYSIPEMLGQPMTMLMPEICEIFKMPLPALLADPARLQQIVWNLLSNSVKFTAKGGTIVVIVRQVRSEVQIQVRDTGEGIAPDFLPQVFNRFSQADASKTRRHSGLGLGLALVRQLVELHSSGTLAVIHGRGLRGKHR